MDVVGHQAIAPHRDRLARAGLVQQIAVELVVRVGEEDALAAIAALGHVMRKSRNHEPADPRHGRLPEFHRTSAKIAKLGQYAGVIVITP